MRYTYPDYYKEFQCVAGACEDTCCAGWQIAIEEESLQKYAAQEGPYRAVLQKSIDWEEQVFCQDRSHRCAFLRDDQLCDLYVELGEESLCKTCREYPRHIEEFENVREITLTLSCPEVARLLVRRELPVRFTVAEDDTKECYEAFDAAFFASLQDIRAELLARVQNRTVPLGERIRFAIAAGWKLQEQWEQGEIMEDWKQTDDVGLADEPVFALFTRLFGVLYELELLNPLWHSLLVESEQLLFSDGEAALLLAIERMEQWWKSGKMLPSDIVLEQLLVYFISTYFCGAVYDGNLVGKLHAGVAHTLLLYLLFVARWLRNDEQLDEEDLMEICYRYSREVEHSDENLELTEAVEWFR